MFHREGVVGGSPARLRQPGYPVDRIRGVASPPCGGFAFVGHTA